MSATTCEFVNHSKCTCTKTECPRHGKCCACVAAHGANGQLPFCLRDLKKPEEQAATQ